MQITSGSPTECSSLSLSVRLERDAFCVAFRVTLVVKLVLESSDHLRIWRAT